MSTLSKVQPPIDIRDWFSLLSAAGITFYSGVPCSLLAGMFTTLSRADTPVDYVPAHIEGEAVALAAGVALAGGLGAVMLQNSGLGNVINPLTSLVDPYGLPMVFIVSWRAQPGVKDAPHHKKMGDVTLPLLDTLGVPYLVVNAKSSTWDADVHALVQRARQERRAVALVLPKSTLGTAEQGPMTPQHHPSFPVKVVFGADASMSQRPTRLDVLNALRSRANDAAIFATTGHTGRELYATQDRDACFYMQGSMGFAGGIALGWQMTSSRAAVIVDGDGALMMRMGSLATIGARHPRMAPWVHLILDNGAYASTGGQCVPNAMCAFADVASACGYDHVGVCVDAQRLDEALAWAFTCGGTVCLHVRLQGGSLSPLPRPSQTPAQLATRFAAWSKVEQSF